MDDERPGLARELDQATPLGMGERASAGLPRGVVKKILDVGHELLLGHLADRLDEIAASRLAVMAPSSPSSCPAPTTGTIESPRRLTFATSLRFASSLSFRLTASGWGLPEASVSSPRQAVRIATGLLAGVESNFARVREKDRRAASLKAVHSWNVRIAILYVVAGPDDL